MLQTALRDNTVNRAYIRQIQNLSAEYELVKAGKHPHFKFANDLFTACGVPRQTFHKVYQRFNITGTPMPGKRGPKRPHKIHPLIERRVVKAREAGFSRFEITSELLRLPKRLTPSPTTIYNICRRHGMNRLRPPQKRARRMIIKEKAGDLMHFDTYHLPRGIVAGVDKKLYLIGGIDDATRLAWVDIMDDATALSAMFGGMTVIRMLQEQYKFRPVAVMTDNGAEFKNKTNPNKHPFERLLLMMECKHYYTKPYRPQSNGKIERFWRTLYEDILEEAEFETMDKLKEELYGYLLYYNEHRPHQSLDNKTPAEFNQICPRIS